MTLGRRIASSRSSPKISQAELASVLGVTRQYISALEHDSRMPSLTILIEFAATLGVTLDYLATGKTEPVSDAIAAVRSDESLKPEAREILIRLITELRKRQ